ncbi:helix-turn-helix domain-containing protein [Caldimonas tepidiphila]|uniref:helix-turn-helix domain-containing protein n=1 Tax=Caldimonas tepidiphila TaxID=2315841 RepID=UPI000E5A305A|nr:helix-turn-helix domain-containing protein [Caldimonas tepidiphila]
MPHGPVQTLVTAQQLSELLRTTRQRLKLNQQDVGDKLNLSQNRVSHLERHPEELSFKQLLAWCAVLGLELQLGVRGAAAAPAQPTEW